MSVPILIRRCETDRERNFVHSSWKHSYSVCRPARIWWDKHNHITRYVQMPLGLFYSEMGRYIDDLFTTNCIYVGVATDQPGLVLGFIAYAEPLLHYVYVAKPFRRFGIARQLCEEVCGSGGVTITNWTPVVENIKLPGGWSYNEVSKWR